MPHYLLAIDQGTTNSRAIIFDQLGNPVSQHEMPLTQRFPYNGWVEQSPDEMFNNTVTCCQEALKKISLSAKSIAAVGIANQRETTIIWDRHTGKPIYPAIVWQDRRTSDLCERYASHPVNASLQEKTGLLLDPYFSATKILWLLDNVPYARDRAERGELLFGTVDTFLLWKLTKGKVHATDITNASRTLLFNIRTQQWDDEILRAFTIPSNLLPQVLDNAAHFGNIHSDILGESIPIAGIAGDQQAATIGQACFLPGMVKATYGTGCFMLLNTGSQLIQSKNQLLSTIAYRISNKTAYGLEGSIFSAGVTIKWMRDVLKIISHATETEELAKRITDTGGVYLIPAFTGLGAPYWDPAARGALLGLTRSSGREHIARAALESVGYQTRDLLTAMQNDSGSTLETLRVDGGMAANNWLLQFLSDMLSLEIERPVCVETSALGAAYLAGLQIGLYPSLDEIARLWRSNARYYPQMAELKRETLYQGWQQAAQRVITRAAT
ncbi:glycerol kinase GlpK [Aquicella lusitana]|uniref:Glycerol kinase n=1 Tax=Aquicella lusitana TaxID=254246 RepID=A0A370GKQ8_9COXI|nr:glycerol kinase GlpK [Aquicella lusitana]RDI43816.1 glycerol kinase [Aquicella lusitana]VVC74453.1 Glycerol kinase [Aquicella lusitana]